MTAFTTVLEITAVKGIFEGDRGKTVHSINQFQV